MAIPTDFSVTTANVKPIANPKPPIDGPQAKDAQQAQSTPAPEAKDAQPEAVTPAPEAKDAQPEAVTPAPEAKDAQPEAVTPAPNAKTPETATITPSPSVKTALSPSNTPAPDALNAENEANTPAPQVLTANPADPFTPPFPLNHARILYDNIGPTYTVLNSTVGTTPVRAINPNTWEGWNFETPGTWFIRFPDFVEVDTICIGAHTLGSEGYSVQPYYASTVGGAFQSFAGVRQPSDDKAIMWHRSSPVTLREIEIRTGNGSTPAHIRYISIGTALQMQRPYFGGSTPFNENRNVRYYDAWSESGNLIARSRRAVSVEGSPRWNNINDAWYRSYFQPFRDSAEELPFFMAWNLLEYPQDVTLCLGRNFDTSYSGTRSLRAVSFDVKGVV